MSWLNDRRVAFAQDRAGYSTERPYHPSESLPEWPGGPVGTMDNPAYRAVRACLYELGFDRARFGSPDWNPLGEMVKPGDVVVLKPNLVSHRNTGEESYGLTDTDSLVTHGSVIRCVLDYVAKALNGRGRIVIGDCPVQGTRWEAIAALVGFDEIRRHASNAFPGIDLRIEDFRLGRATMVGDQLVARSVDESRLDDYQEVDVGTDSLLVELMDRTFAFGVAQYPRHRMVRAHTPVRNVYLMPKAFLQADVFINLPKFKSHMKAGVTCALKNLVGVNGHKDYLPHFRFGSPKNGGDEYPDGNWLWDLMWGLLHAEWEIEAGPRKRALHRAAMVCYAALRRFYGYRRGYLSVGGGGWHGNDTLWRTIADINRAFLYYDPATNRVDASRAPSRRYLAIIDGLVAGHRESPLAPTPYPAGVMLAATNPLAVDAVAAALMGFDWRRIRQIARAWTLPSMPIAAFGPDDVRIVGHPRATTIDDIYRTGSYMRFEPSVGFEGAIEVAERHDETRRAPSDQWSAEFRGSEDAEPTKS